MNTKHRILIVDDSDMNRDILADMLEDEFDIIEASNGNEAIALLTRESNTISLVLLDIIMPEADGFTVLEVMNKLNMVEDVPVIMISSETAPRSIEQAYQMGANDYITRPYNMTVVKRRITNTIMLYAKQRKLIDLVSEQIRDKERNNGMLINILSHIVEFRNGESGMHVLHIRTITAILLEELIKKTDKYKITTADALRISNASALHDIGKISIPDSILNKPGKLTDEEYEVMKTHSAVGADLINQIPQYQGEPLIKTAYEICRWHHERYDGKGYPDGLKGDDIPISAQIVSIADVYDALTSERVYKKAFTHEKALEMIVNGECGAFSQLIIDCLLSAADRLKIVLSDNKSTDKSADETEAKLVASEILKSQDLSIVDSTTEMLSVEKNKLNFLMSVSRDVIYEYSAVSDTLILSNNAAEKFGLKRYLVNPYSDKRFVKMFGESADKSLIHRLRITSPNDNIIDEDIYIDLQSGPTKCHINAIATWSNDVPSKYLGSFGKITFINNEG